MSTPHAPESDPAPVVSRAKARLVCAFAFAALGVWVARDFLVPLAWAAVLGVAFWPLYRRVLSRVPSAWPDFLAPLLFTLAAALVIVVPLGFAAVQIGYEGQAAIEWLGRVQQTGLPEPHWLEHVPVVGNAMADWWREHLARPEQATALLGDLDKPALANWTKLVGGQFVHLAFVFLMSMVALFFVFRDGTWLGNRLLDQLEWMLGDPGERLAERLALAARGTFNGTVLVAVAEGVLIGAGYMIAGVPEPVLFGALTIAFALLPFGAWFAFTLAALVLLSLNGSVLAASLLFAWGAAVMLVGDNVAQPAFIGGSIRLPFLWTLVGIFGGAQTFGLVGLFLGPTIMTGVMTIWREWIGRTRARSDAGPSEMRGRRGQPPPGWSGPLDLIS